MQTLTFNQVVEMADAGDDQTGIVVHMESQGDYKIATPKSLINELNQFLNDDINGRGQETYDVLLKILSQYSHFVLLADHEASLAYYESL